MFPILRQLNERLRISACPFLFILPAVRWSGGRSADFIYRRAGSSLASRASLAPQHASSARSVAFFGGLGGEHDFGCAVNVFALGIVIELTLPRHED